MATQVSICSAALLLVGDVPIASLTESSKRALICANLYPIARRELLRAHNWNCTIKRVVLAPEVTAPAFEWQASFPLPGDCLRVLGVGAKNEFDDYVLESKRILADLATVNLVYVADTDEEFWDDLLVDVMVRRMAADLAYPIAKSTSLKEAMTAEFRATLRHAKSVDGQENPPEAMDDSVLISVR
jgi:hypothetical protein